MFKGITGAIFIIIGLGLILRFGKTSHALAGDIKDTSLGLVNALTLQTWGGNTP